MMKCLEMLVMTQINSCLINDLDPLLFAQCCKATAGAISFALHSALDHLDNRNTCIGLFISIQDFRPFQTRCLYLGELNLHSCNWIFILLISRLQSVQIVIMSTGYLRAV